MSNTKDAVAKTAAALSSPRREPPERRTHQRVRRHSKPQGCVRYAPISSREASERIMALRRWERRREKTAKTKNAAVGHVGLEVYEAICRLAARGRGRLDLTSYGELARMIRRARSAVVRAVGRLRRFGWLWWIRQFNETGEHGVRGPQVEQAANAYILIAPREELVKFGIRFGPPPIPDEVAWAAEECAAALAEMEKAAFDASPLGQALDRLGAAISRRERETS